MCGVNSDRCGRGQMSGSSEASGADSGWSGAGSDSEVDSVDELDGSDVDADYSPPDTLPYTCTFDASPLRYEESDVGERRR